MLIVALVVLAGGGAIIGLNLLGDGGLAGAATSSPSDVAQGTGAPSADPVPSDGEPTSSPTAEPTPAPPKNETLKLLGASASSVLDDLPAYQATMAIDGDPATSWQEGSTREKGEWIEVVFAPSKVSAVVVTNGDNSSEAAYRASKRLKNVEIRVGDAPPQTFRLKDTGSPQKLDVKNVSGAVAVRITILSTYPSVETSVPGSPFDNAALAEIQVRGVPGS